MSSNPYVTKVELGVELDKQNQKIDLKVNNIELGVNGSIDTTTDTTSLPDGVYRAQIPGTYTNAGNIVVKEGYYTLLRKLDDGSWVLESEVKIPMQDLTKIETELESTKTKVDDFIRDFAVTTDTEFDSKSNNPIANKAVAPLAEVLSGFTDGETTVFSMIGANLGLIDDLKNYYSNTTYRCKIFNLPTGDKYLNFRGYKPNAQQQQVDKYSCIFVELDTGVIQKIIPATFNSESGDLVELKNIKLPNNAVKMYVNVMWVGTSVNYMTLIEISNGEISNVKDYVDERLIVLDSFLQTEEIAWEELNSLTSQINDTITNINWVKESYIGKNTGDLSMSDLKGYEKIKISGSFATDPHAYVLWLGGYNNTTGIYDKIVEGKPSQNEFIFDIDPKYEGYLVSFGQNIKIYKGKKIKKSIEKDAVLKSIENGVGSGSKISQKTKAKIAYPTNLIELNFETKDALPTAKPTLAKGVLSYTDNAGTAFKKYATLEVQGSSSAGYPKKNWTFALFNKEDYTNDFKIRIGNWAYHSEFVFKSNWIDATHARNILSNKIWEDIIQSRKYFPKRENEISYIASNTNVGQRFDSGALCHVDGVPAKLFVNGDFYGIGMFSLGKKIENYDLKSSNQNHIQLAAKTHANFNSYIAEQWEIRNPKSPDANFQTKINAWFASNALTGQAFKNAFETNHVLKNAIEFFLLAEFIQSPDMYTKNLILTSWDGVKFYFLPYDMDTTFGLQWDGLSFTGHNGSIRDTSFWSKFYNAYSVEIKARYKELRDSGVFTLENVYKHADKMNKTFGLDSFEEEFACWNVPSNSTIYTSYPQIYQWVKDRLIWLDSQYL